MTTLFEVLLHTARALEALQEGVTSAASGGPTTIVDAQLPVRGFTVDDHFKGGTLLYQSTEPLPVRASRIVTTYSGGTGTITVPALPETPPFGSRYGVMTDRYPREVMVGKIKEALAEIGDLPTVETGLVVTASNTLEYSLPVAAKRDLRQVWLARSTTAPWRWEQQLRVRTEWTAANVAGVLLFPEQPRVGYKIKLVYMAPHQRMVLDDDNLSDYVSVEIPALEAAAKCVRWRMEGPGANERDLTALFNNLTLRAAAAKQHHPVKAPQAFPMLP